MMYIRYIQLGNRVRRTGVDRRTTIAGPKVMATLQVLFDARYPAVSISYPAPALPYPGTLFQTLPRLVAWSVIFRMSCTQQPSLFVRCSYSNSMVATFRLPFATTHWRHCLISVSPPSSPTVWVPLPYFLTAPCEPSSPVDHFTYTTAQSGIKYAGSRKRKWNLLPGSPRSFSVSPSPSWRYTGQISNCSSILIQARSHFLYPMAPAWHHLPQHTTFFLNSHFSPSEPMIVPTKPRRRSEGSHPKHLPSHVSLQAERQLALFRITFSCRSWPRLYSIVMPGETPYHGCRKYGGVKKWSYPHSVESIWIPTWRGDVTWNMEPSACIFAVSGWMM